MSEVAKRIAALRQYVDDDAAAAIEQLIREAPDARLNRINPLAFAIEHGLAEQTSVAAFLHATQAGLFELSWNVICSSCGGILHSAESLRAIDQDHYSCALCAADCEPNLDEVVEVTFTVDPRVRRIAAHDPDSMPLWNYVRQIYWSSGSDLPDDLAPVVKDAVLDAVELAPGSSIVRSVRVDQGLTIVFDPVTHTAQFVEVAGPADDSDQEIEIAIDEARLSNETLRVSPGQLKLSLQNNTSRRVMPIFWIVGEALMEIARRRIPVLTAKRLLAHQTFRELYRTNVLDVNQRFKITSLTFMFTDIKGSTALYERIGDLAAYDLIRSHFQIAQAIISREGGAVVKTIGDAIMATFPKPAQGLAAAFEIRKAISASNERDSGPELLLKVGLHTGPCLAVSMNERQDYFGQTVNIASRVQGISSPDLIFATPSVVDDDEVRHLIERRGSAVRSSKAMLRGLSEEMLIYNIPH